MRISLICHFGWSPVFTLYRFICSRRVTIGFEFRFYCIFAMQSLVIICRNTETAPKTSRLRLKTWTQFSR